jgi:pyruvate dehydrogenase E2 component (dihydrolipoamide acetyltransferase)
MDAAVELRASLKELAAGAAPSYNDMVVKACALALRQHPRANGSYRDGRFELHSAVNVGVAVAVPDALVVPTVFGADVMSLGEIGLQTRRLAELARTGALTPPDMAGATFTVSNLRMFGVTHFTAVINPPQAAILAVGALQPRAVVRDGALVAGRRMSLTLTSDHRILYGADAAAFLADVRAALQQPLRLVL